MTVRVLVSIGALVAIAAVCWWWFARCERACAAIDRDTQELFQRGELLSALALIDAVDARCRCARFTSGDAPPQYALALTSLRQLLIEGRSSEVRRLLANARGPILKELATQAVFGGEAHR